VPTFLAYAILAALVLVPIWTTLFLARRMNRRAIAA
jgi:hypothetical protein